MRIALTNWTHLWHLAALGATAAGGAALRSFARRRRPPRWLVIHILGMGGSYVGLLTAFYVDNGPRPQAGTCCHPSPSGYCPASSLHPWSSEQCTATDGALTREYTGDAPPRT